MTSRRLTPTTRRLLATAIPVAAMTLIPVTAGPTAALADPMIGQVINRYGLPGIIDTPTAEAMPDATLGAALSWNELGNRTGLSFQVLPRVSVALRYGTAGEAQTLVAFRPRERFLGNFLRLLGEPAREGEVVFLEPIHAGTLEGRAAVRGYGAGAAGPHARGLSEPCAGIFQPFQGDRGRPHA